MKSVEEFLKKFKEAQASASFQHELLSTDLSEFELDSTLTSALERGWHVAPVLTHSKHFMRTALAGYPTQDLVQLRHWVREYSECGCNWVVETGARSSLLVLEYTHDIGREMVRYLCEDDRSWRTTLQFTDQNARFVCFRYSGEQIRPLGSDFPGVRINLGSRLLIPPSSTAKGLQLSYLNPGARVLELPGFLLDVRPAAATASNPSRAEEADYVAALGNCGGTRRPSAIDCCWAALLDRRHGFPNNNVPSTPMKRDASGAPARLSRISDR